MTAWLSIVGIGEDGMAGLAPAARALVETAEVLIGGDRHLSMVPETGAERLSWPSPLLELVEKIPAMRPRRVCIVATGDPMLYGIGATLAERIAPEEMTVLPGASAFSLAAARLGWPLETTALLTLHGRPVEKLALHVEPGARLLILAHNRRTASAVGEWLVDHGFGESRMVALAHMGGPAEQRIEATAATWALSVPDFHTLAVECVAGENARWFPRTAGLADSAYEHDGKLTKREFRAHAIAQLMPRRGALLWDIGAGCGSIGIEWMRAAEGARAIALEPLADRRAMAAHNAAALGVPGLDIRDARAPAALAELPEPDAIFIGGGLQLPVLVAARERLKVGGRLVAHAVTLGSEQLLIGAFQRNGGELIRIAVSRAETRDKISLWRPTMPVLQYAWTKPPGWKQP